MESDYKGLLKRVMGGLPESVLQKERFEIPKVMGHVQGNRTIISNFSQIAHTLRRDQEHMLKYILKELAAPGEIKKSGSVIFGTKIPASRVNEKIRKYAHEFVLCPECGKPDTKIENDGDFAFLKCAACGSKHHVKARI